MKSTRESDPVAGASPMDKRDRADAIVCACTNLTLDDIRAYAASGNSYDAFLAKSGAGQACTSCLLDLEYHFERAPAWPAPSVDRAAGIEARRGLKRRLFDWLDAHSPMVPFKRVQRGPLLIGSDISQWLIIANHSLLYEREFVPPSCEASVCIYDGDGRGVAATSAHINTGDTMRLDLTTEAGDALAAAAPGSLAVGSFELICHWSSPGVRGTMRPQIIVAASGGCSAVHTTGASAAATHWVTGSHRPEATRQFVSIVNVSGAAAKAVVSYPHGIPGLEPQAHETELASRGAGIAEIRLDRKTHAELKGRPFDIRIDCRALKNVHFISASPDLRRVSIDHI